MVDTATIMKLRRSLLPITWFAVCSIFFAPPAHAGIARGIARLLTAPLEIPKAMLQGGLNPVNMVGGAVTGTARTVTSMVSGVSEMTQGTASTATQAAKTAAPYAKYAPLLLL